MSETRIKSELELTLKNLKENNNLNSQHNSIKFLEVAIQNLEENILE
jgi:hypothetical protein